MTKKEQEQQEIQEFQKFLKLAAKAENVDPDTYVKNLKEEDIEKAYGKFKELKEKGISPEEYFEKLKTKKLQRGMKLNYLNSLKLENCKDDEELYFFKKGGSVGCGCKKKKKAQNGDKLKKLCGGKKFLGKGKKIKVSCHQKGGTFQDDYQWLLQNAKEIMKSKPKPINQDYTTELLKKVDSLPDPNRLRELYGLNRYGNPFNINSNIPSKLRPPRVVPTNTIVLPELIVQPKTNIK